MISLLLAAALVAPEGHVNQWYSHAASDPSALPVKNIGNEVVYQIFVDRFANGNTANDCLFDQRFCDPERRDWYQFWGGDLRGIIGRLDYLKALGATRLWLTPILENEMVTVKRQRHGREIEMTPYHGYWIRDWFRLNPFFTDRGNQDFDVVDELIQKAKPEIRVLLDTVANHTSPADPTDWSRALARSDRGALYRDGVFVASIDDDRRRPQGDKRFHVYGWITDWNDQFQVENHQLDGLSDLDQVNPAIKSYMDDAHAFWLRKFPDLAGYRMDTIKHINHSYWRAFDQKFFGEFPAAEIVGEYFSGGPLNGGSQAFYRETRQTMFDFDFRNTIEAVFLRNQSMSAFGRLWAADHRLLDARGIVTFVDNHDLPRLRGMGMSLSAMRQAIALMFMARGIPSVYYGMEQDLFYPGDPGDPYNRPMMSSFDPSAPLFRMIAALSALRKSNPALRYGRTHVVHESDHILAFERIHESGAAFFATSKNPISGVDRFEMQGLTLPDGEYRDQLSGKVYRVRAGRMPVELANGDVVVLSSVSDRP